MIIHPYMQNESADQSVGLGPTRVASPIQPSNSGQNRSAASTTLVSPTLATVQPEVQFTTITTRKLIPIPASLPNLTITPRDLIPIPPTDADLLNVQTSVSSSTIPKSSVPNRNSDVHAVTSHPATYPKPSSDVGRAQHDQFSMFDALNELAEANRGLPSSPGLFLPQPRPTMTGPLSTDESRQATRAKVMGSTQGATQWRSVMEDIHAISVPQMRGRARRLAQEQADVASPELAEDNVPCPCGGACNHPPGYKLPGSAGSKSAPALEGASSTRKRRHAAANDEATMTEFLKRIDATGRNARESIKERRLAVKLGVMRSAIVDEWDRVCYHINFFFVNI
jgi:hypothetical protein